MDISNIPPELIGSISNLQPFLDEFHRILAKFEIIIGGVFGLYLVFSVIRLVMDRKNRKMLKEIKHELKIVSARLEKIEQDKNSKQKGQE